MKIQELHSVKEIQATMEEYWNKDNNMLLPPLFHGTDASLIDISKQERQRINAACEIIIESLVRLVKSLSISFLNDKLLQTRDSRTNSADAFVKAEARLNRSPLYRYGDFYVTTEPGRAASFSQEAWILGETGEVTNLLVKGVTALGLDLPNDQAFMRAYEVYEERKARSHDPVVLMVVDCNSHELFRVSGTNVMQENTDFFIRHLEDLKDKTVGGNYMIGKHTLENDAKFFVIKPRLYNDLIRIWERV